MQSSRFAKRLRSMFALTGDQWTTLVFVQAWVFVLTLGSSLFKDPGTFWHVVVGERILSSGLPHSDWLSFTRAGTPWVAHQWLAELAMAMLYRGGGFDGMLLVFSGGLALLVAFLFHRLHSAGVRPGWSVLLTVLAVFAMLHHLHARPHVASLLLFAWTYSELVAFETGRSSRLRLAALVPVFALWTNLHGAALGGLATVAIVGAGWVLRAALSQPSPAQGVRGVAFTAALGIACCAAVLVNPFGLALPQTWIAIMSSRPLAQVMLEHQSFLRSPAWLSTPMLLALAGGLAASRWRSLRVTTLASIVWLVLGLERTRHIPLAAIAATFALPDLLRHTRWPGRWTARILSGQEPQGTDTGVRWPALAATAALAACTALGTQPRAHESPPRFVHLVPRWPMKLLPELRAVADSLPPGAPILNDMLFGGFLSFYTPGLRIFIDDRWELYGDAFVLAYVGGTDSSYQEWMSRFAPRVALAEPGSRLDRHLAADPRWELTARDAAARLYRRLPSIETSSASAR